MYSGPSGPCKDCISAVPGSSSRSAPIQFLLFLIGLSSHSCLLTSFSFGVAGVFYLAPSSSCSAVLLSWRRRLLLPSAFLVLLLFFFFFSSSSSSRALSEVTRGSQSFFGSDGLGTACLRSVPGLVELWPVLVSFLSFLLSLLLLLFLGVLLIRRHG